MRYYFHLVSSQQIILDTTGVEIRDPATVQHMVPRLIREVQKEPDQTAKDWEDWRIDVEDPFGNVIVSVPLDTSLP
ncbi:DUF6894 family protein [Microvirga ossetica]|uniref:DUF6894 family protein n=1 Tax=Microvirga ossetica TaxID=1882682 RepID=UPI000C149F88|nr:hypothetical protein [Microvirga ossetica]